MFSFPGMLECPEIPIKKTGAPETGIESVIIFGFIKRLGWPKYLFLEIF